MSNVELVRALQPSRLDLVAFTLAAEKAPPPAAFAEDFESLFVAEGANTQLGPFRGFTGFLAGWREWLEAWERYELYAEEFIDAGERVVVLARVHARTSRAGVDVEHTPAAVYTVKDGLVQRVEFYLDRAEALRSAGLDD